MDSSQIKRAARSLLRGRFAVAIVVSLAIGAASALAFILFDTALFLAGLIDYENGTFVFTDLANTLPAMVVFLLAIALMWVLLAMPLRLGTTRWFFALADFGYPSVDSIFYAFGKGQYIRSLKFCLRLFGAELVWAVVCCLPGLLLSGAGIAMGGGAPVTEEAMTVSPPDMLYYLGIMLFAVGFVVSKVVCLRYFSAMYVFTSSETVTGKEAVKLSVRIMKGRKSGLVLLMLSFVGLLLLSVPTVGIILIYTVPYYNTAKAIYAKGSIDTFLAVQAAENADKRQES